MMFFPVAIIVSIVWTVSWLFTRNRRSGSPHFYSHQTQPAHGWVSLTDSHWPVEHSARKLHSSAGLVG